MKKPECNKCSSTDFRVADDRLICNNCGTEYYSRNNEIYMYNVSSGEQKLESFDYDLASLEKKMDLSRNIEDTVAFKKIEKKMELLSKELEEQKKKSIKQRKEYTFLNANYGIEKKLLFVMIVFSQIFGFLFNYQATKFNRSPGLLIVFGLLTLVFFGLTIYAFFKQPNNID